MVSLLLSKNGYVLFSSLYDYESHLNDCLLSFESDCRRIGCLGMPGDGSTMLGLALTGGGFSWAYFYLTSEKMVWVEVSW